MTMTFDEPLDQRAVEEQFAESAKKTRKKRSDAGKPKPKPVEPGTITSAQALEIKRLARLLFERREALGAAQMEYSDTEDAFNQFIESLAVRPK